MNQRIDPYSRSGSKSIWRPSRPASAPTQPVAPSASATWRDGHIPVIMAGLAATTIGLALPWLTVAAAFLGQVNRNGFDTPDGKIIAGIVFVVGLIAWGSIEQPTRGKSIAVLIGGLAILGIALVDHGDLVNRIAELNSNPYGRADIGFGLYLSGFGGLITAIGALNRLRSS